MILKNAFLATFLSMSMLQATTLQTVSNEGLEPIIEFEYNDPMFIYVPSRLKFMTFWDDMWEECPKEIDFFWIESFGLPYLKWKNIHVVEPFHFSGVVSVPDDYSPPQPKCANGPSQFIYKLSDPI